ncbi:flavin reductase family protein [Wenjunlia tyrosinilytica]|uniref:Oxidoreductase n=1 Tax=Wenjunlia tyrosinilytica TaxID=1544741 RepID=A0A918E1Z8_9ACTN|nr:flavin reductase family protein [Wenjunlia tyrosinilytica]GGO97941.1 oxidoreductase [Wenjunlia tyrosinilytica]
MSEFDAFTAPLDYPMYVVTTAAGEERAGCLVGFASQCSIKPPRFVVWLSKKNHTYRVAVRATHAAVHLLGPDQRDLAELFGSRTGDEIDKFSHVGCDPGPAGVPVLRDARAWFVGPLGERADWGDHVGFLLTPEQTSASEEVDALITLKDVLGLAPGHPA